MLATGVEHYPDFQVSLDDTHQRTASTITPCFPWRSMCVLVSVKVKECSFTTGFLSRLRLSDKSRFRASALLSGRQCLRVFNGSGPTQLFLSSLFKPCSMICMNVMSSMDGATLLSSLVCWNTVEPYCSAGLPQVGFSGGCTLGWLGSWEWLYLSSTWKTFGQGSKMKGCFCSVVLVKYSLWWVCE